MTGMAWHRSGHDGAVHPFGCNAATVIMRARSFNRPLSDGAGHPLGLRDYMERPADIGHDTSTGKQQVMALSSSVTSMHRATCGGRTS